MSRPSNRAIEVPGQVTAVGRLKAAITRDVE